MTGYIGDRKRVMLGEIPECGVPDCTERAAARGGEQGAQVTLGGTMAIQWWAFLCDRHAREFKALMSGHPGLLAG